MLSASVIRHFQQIHYAEKSRLPREHRRNIRQPDRRNGIDFNLALFHSIPPANLHMRPLPNPNTARDLSPPHSFAQPLREYHLLNLPPSSPAPRSSSPPPPPVPSARKRSATSVRHPALRDR